MAYKGHPVEYLSSPPLLVAHLRWQGNVNTQHAKDSSQSPIQAHCTLPPTCHSHERCSGDEKVAVSVSRAVACSLVKTPPKPTGRVHDAVSW